MNPLTTNDSTVTGTSREYSFANNQWYWWRVAAINDVGRGNWSTTWSFKTYNYACTDCPSGPCENSVYYGGGEGTDPQPDQIDPCLQWRTLHQHQPGEENQRSTPTHYALDQNSPNPFNPTTRFSFALPNDEHVVLKVYDILGEEVATVLNEFQTKGYRSVEFDASSLPSGLYFYRLQAGTFVDTKKMMLVK